MIRSIFASLFFLFFTNNCFTHPVNEKYARSADSRVDVLNGSHVLEFRESSRDREARLGAQLIALARSGDVRQVVRLLCLGASVTLQDRLGNTALHYAAMGATQDHCRIAMYLLSRGANPARANLEGNNPVYYAACHPAMLHIFMRAGGLCR
jgi:ankyrin repeat protein